MITKVNPNPKPNPNPNPNPNVNLCTMISKDGQAIFTGALGF